ncbi:phospholipase B1, membrane-associated [Drosophila grimshawi]|uniref:Phospholipase B1, membrane-associated n=1 Tax=Drosophila grimshawi TaxID=7222 RepID=B4JC67_DROGR|nr:phospholipase B1, membrane-associated [Drosophila grimshawi]EDW03080.1 GH11045 [Drosophila grimshawi]
MCSSIFGLLVLVVLVITTNAAHLHRIRRQNRSDQLLASIGIHAQAYKPVREPMSKALPAYTNIDRDFRHLFIQTRTTTLNWALQDMDALYKSSRREGKMQTPIPGQVPFPCPLNNTRSRIVPISVERLRPGDIDIIAAIGDSLSAGNGIMSHSALDVINEFRGLGFSGGGMGNWRNTLTLPNILKEFNPQLYGYATGHSLVVNHKISRLSIAEPMVMSHDLLYQARVLIDLLQRDPHVDMQRHWKLLTVYVGNNDVCSDMCHWTDPQSLLDQHARDLRQAFRLLRDNVPRLVINMIAVPNVPLTMSHLKQVPFECFLVHRIACHCLMSDRLSREQLEQRMDTIRRWQQLDLDVARLPEFQRKDFAIIGHPLITNLTTPLLPNGNTDWRIFSHDCFHFSQRMHAIVSNMLWNSMLLPDEQKPRPNILPKLFEKFLCPSKEQPFLVVRPS